ncbi:hypothetical protein DFH09DRAFT_1463723 [Mycena vulgaris]|nr:hypothetical protein DFH09DRAFT_1463723 [Mycena vulgaris]
MDVGVEDAAVDEAEDDGDAEYNADESVDDTDLITYADDGPLPRAPIRLVHGMRQNLGDPIALREHLEKPTQTLRLHVGNHDRELPSTQHKQYNRLFGASKNVDLYDPLKRPSRPSFDGPLLEGKNGRRDGHGTRSTGAVEPSRRQRAAALFVGLIRDNLNSDMQYSGELASTQFEATRQEIGVVHICVLRRRQSDPNCSPAPARGGSGQDFAQSISLPWAQLVLLIYRGYHAAKILDNMHLAPHLEKLSIDHPYGCNLRMLSGTNLHGIRLEETTFISELRLYTSVWDWSWGDRLIPFLKRLTTDAQFLPNLETLRMQWLIPNLPHEVVDMLESRWYCRSGGDVKKLKSFKL